MSIISVIGMRGFPAVQGGVEIHCENLYTRFHGVKLRIYRRKPYLASESMVTYPDIEFVDLPSTRIKGFEAVVHTFFAVVHILFHRPDVVHIHNIGPGMFTPILKLFGLRVVITYHSPNYEHKKWGFFARRLLKFSESLSLKFADKVIFVNKFQMQKYDAKTQDKSVFIPNGINNVSRSSATDFLAKHGIMKDEYVLCVGRLTPEKGFEYIVRAANELDCVKQVVIAGASDHDDSYFRTLQSLDTNHKVVFTQFTSGENLRQLYSHARLFALTSVNEGFPLVLLEAMSYQLPIIASDIPASHLIELPADRYFESANVESLKATLSSKIATSNAPVTYDTAQFDWQTIANRTLNTILDR